MDYCAICGHPIGPNNPYGIGAECAAAIKCAQAYKAAQDGLRLKKHIYKSRLVKEEFVKMFQGTKFRSQFRSDFFAHIQQTDHITVRQLEVMCDWIERKNGYVILEDIKKKVEDYTDQIVSAVTVTRDEIERARQYIRKHKR
nr:MAG TPA: hypothetical protein [Caudoviricetes sp.]